eukprot:Partr_v1_DN27264_c0_g2_i2_m38419 putative Biotin_carb_C
MLRRLLSTAAVTPTQRLPLVDKILIANRGEIACRVMRTANKLGVRSVAVYSDIDSQSMHVSMADEAYRIGSAPSSESYLLMDKILEVAKASGARAIHPGYGFLSENAEFAEKIEREGLIFIGPPASAIRAMGSKSASKSIMSKAGVPVVPGYHGDNQDPEFLKAQAAEIGYPVLIKAIKGGGGKGMRIVESADDFHVMLESSKRESRKSFGDDRVLIEKYLIAPRHVEVQVFCDKHGNAVYLFERDCSVQRRHQKVIEEAPAPDLSEELRRDLGEKAVAAAQAVKYVGAGTVEFIMDSQTRQFYFMEMNTRLQVEHPVTEMVTGTDLVEWQLEVASGNVLPKFQDELKLNGHCFETRIYAEAPRNNFLPDTGKLIHLVTPEPSASLRVETGVREGDEVSVYYDPMIAKLVVWGPDRPTALKRLAKALDEYEVVGPQTNIEFLKRLAIHPEFVKGNVETGFIPRYADKLLPPIVRDSKTVFQAVMGLVLHENALQNSVVSPWSSIANFRMNLKNTRTVKFAGTSPESPEISVAVTYSPDSDSYALNYSNGAESKAVDNVRALIDKSTTDKCTFTLLFPNERIKSTVVMENDKIHLFTNSEESNYHSFTMPKLVSTDTSKIKSGLDIRSPMPSKISNVLVKVGQTVKQGEPLV